MEAIGAMHQAIAMKAASRRADEADDGKLPHPTVHVDIPPAVHEARARFRTVVGIKANPYEDALRTVSERG